MRDKKGGRALYVYVELWNAKQTWLDMSRSEREAFVSAVKENIGGLADAGVELLHFSILDEDVPHRAEYRYLAVWSMPNRQSAEALEKDVEAAGFHDLFEQVNARGEAVGPDTLFKDMIGL